MSSEQATPNQVLYVGDRDNDRRQADPKFERLNVTVASSGEIAADHLEQGSVDCVLVEHELGDMTGLEFLRQHQEDHPDIPVILTVPTVENDITKTALNAGASDCLPVSWIDHAELVENRITQLLDANRRQESRLPADQTAVTKFELLAENVDEYAIFLLDTDGYVVSWNTGAEKLKGYQRDEILGQHFSVFYPPDAVQKDRPAENLVTAIVDGSVTDEGWRVRKDGSQFWAQVTITALYDDEDTLQGFAKITRDMTERHEKEAALDRERQLNEQFRVLVENVEDYAIFRLDPRGNIVSWNEGAKQIKGYENDEILGQHFSVFYPRDAVEQGIPMENLAAADENDRVEDEGWRVRKDGSQFWAHVTITALRDESGSLHGFAKITRDMTERRQYEQALEQQRDELAALEQMNAVIRQIDQVLVEATSQQEVETTVCQQLTANEAYSFAWIGGFDSRNHRVQSRASAGADDVSVDELQLSLEDETRPELIETALQTHTLQVVQNVRTDGASEPWRDAALAVGFQSAVAVPIVYEENIYGVLCVYERRPYAFGDREVDVLGELGETIGHAIHALQTRKMLLAESVLELEFLITDPGSALVTASEHFGAEFTVEGVTDASEGVVLYYAALSGVEYDAFDSYAREVSAIDRTRLISETGDGCFVELAVSGASPMLTLTDLGCDVQSATADSGELRLIVDVAPDREVRSIVEAVKAEFSEVDLIAQRQTDRSMELDKMATESLANELTSRQQTVLRSAYHAGFFKQPRESTGEELAASLGINSSTFHQHFRAAERKLVEAFLEE